MEVEGFEHDGGAITQEPDTLEVLREYGVPDQVLDTVKTGLLRQSDYTRKTQELAREREQLLQQQAYLAGMAASQPPKKEDDPFEQYVQSLLERDQSQEAREVADNLRRLNAAQRAAFQRELEKATAPQQQTILRIEAKETLESWCEENLVKDYGQGVMKLMTKPVKDFIIAEMVAGRQVDPKNVIARAFPDEMFELEAQKRQRKKETTTSRHLEGTTTQRTARPVGTNAAGPRVANKQQARQLDDADLGAHILRSMGINK